MSGSLIGEHLLYSRNCQTSIVAPAKPGDYQGIYDFIWKFEDEKDFCPSINDVAEALDLGTSTVATYVETLIEKGYVTSEYGIPRSLRTVEIEA